MQDIKTAIGFLIFSAIYFAILFGVAIRIHFKSKRENKDEQPK